MAGATAMEARETKEAQVMGGRRLLRLPENRVWDLLLLSTRPPSAAAAAFFSVPFSLRPSLVLPFTIGDSRVLGTLPPKGVSLSSPDSLGWRSRTWGAFEQPQSRNPLELTGVGLEPRNPPVRLR